jgi:mannose-6-phosphate isomerase
MLDVYKNMKISRLYPECKDYIWGGEKLKIKYGKETDKTPCAESWELSFHKDGLTRLANGKTLAESVRNNDLGENVKNFPFFSVLAKFIDVKENLSVQVHPSDEYALKHENSFGKTEMWYIVEAEEGAGIFLGFNRDVSKEEYERAIKEKRLTELLNFYEVKAGECYFIPSGTIHAIGKGCLICEIQQNSNLTYRVYDYGRKDKNGNERELHIEKALKVTNLNKFEPITFENCLGKCEYFTVEKYEIGDEKKLCTDEKSFQCITCVKGNGLIDDSIPVGFFGESSDISGTVLLLASDYGRFITGEDIFIDGGTHL